MSYAIGALSSVGRNVSNPIQIFALKAAQQNAQAQALQLLQSAQAPAQNPMMPSNVGSNVDVSA